MIVKFGCRTCGVCCKYYTAMLTIYDCAVICKNTGLRIKDFAEFYLEGSVNDAEDDLYIETKSGRYLLGLKKNENGCVFLKDNRCSINDIKPPVCKLYPLEMKLEEDDTVSYSVKQYDICNGDYLNSETDFGKVDEIFNKLYNEQYYHKVCLKDWKNHPDKLDNSDEFVLWLENAINNGWPENGE